MKTIELKQLKEKLSYIIEMVEKGTVIRIVSDGKDLIEMRPIYHNKEREIIKSLKDKGLLGGGNGKIGNVRSVKNLKPEMPISDIVAEDRR